MKRQTARPRILSVLGVTDEANASKMDYGQRYNVVVQAQSCIGLFGEMLHSSLMNLPRRSKA